MDFTLSPDIEDLRLRVRAFIEKEVLPLEADRKNFSQLHAACLLVKELCK